MTEAEWLACDNPMPMLQFLNGKASDRKLRLFAVACCRRLWPLLTDQRSRLAVDMAECLADGLATEPERAASEAAADEATRDAILARQANDSLPEMFLLAAKAARYSVLQDVGTEAAGATVAAYRLISRNPASGLSNRPAANATCSASLRDIFGAPFRPVPLLSDWLTSTVVALARGIYDERAFDRLPILADALQDTGCDNKDILSHCRGPGPHVRGCWVVDAVLNKG
jgi:hypothetical protein